MSPISLLSLRARSKTPPGGKNGPLSNEEPAKRAQMWVATTSLNALTSLWVLDTDMYLMSKKGKFLFPLKLEVEHRRLMRLVPVKIYLFFLYVSLPLTPALRHLFKQLTATVCMCVCVCEGMCVLYITLLILQEAKWRPFMLKPVPSPLMKPVLVFVNPKSGGNQVGRYLPSTHEWWRRNECCVCLNLPITSAVLI